MLHNQIFVELEIPLMLSRQHINCSAHKNAQLSLSYIYTPYITTSGFDILIIFPLDIKILNREMERDRIRTLGVDTIWSCSDMNHSREINYFFKVISCHWTHTFTIAH